jgi:serine/threonine protein phosphatase PrpC
VQLNEQLNKDQRMDESGTTAAIAYLRGGTLHVANVGDSRTVLAQRTGAREGGQLVATDLSEDQTPFRKDERERCKQAGAIVRTLGMIDGHEKFTYKWESALGTTDEPNNGDPPRLFRNFKNAWGAMVPGVCFTRSIGDKIADDIGVYAEPELATHELTESDQMLIVASDGVFEFLPFQTVVEMAARYESPLSACHAIVAESYNLYGAHTVHAPSLRPVPCSLLTVACALCVEQVQAVAHFRRPHRRYHRHPRVHLPLILASP